MFFFADRTVKIVLETFKCGNNIKNAFFIILYQNTFGLGLLQITMLKAMIIKIYLAIIPDKIFMS